jgi:hypothetical protein
MVMAGWLAIRDGHHQAIPIVRAACSPIQTSESGVKSAFIDAPSRGNLADWHADSTPYHRQIGVGCATASEEADSPWTDRLEQAMCAASERDKMGDSTVITSAGGPPHPGPLPVGARATA